jgi:uncharacterized protein YggT (Ycf19 family)
MREVVVVLGPIMRVLDWVLQFIIWTVFVWVILSWILFFASQTSFRWRYRGFFHVLTQLNDIFTRMTYPLLRPFRRMTRRWDTAGIDWSPLLLLIAIYLIRAIIEGIWGLILLQVK